MTARKAARWLWAVGCAALAAQAGMLEGQLRDGSRVEIDTATNRATMIGPGGQRTPLWDGVHTLQNGTALRIQQGVVQPDLPVVEAPRRPDEAETGPGGSAAQPGPCERLVDRVCGTRQQCAATQGCDAARQLLVLERSERTKTASRVAMTPTANSCGEALLDEAFFAPCRH